MQRTVGGKEVLDPAGREPRIYPSKARTALDEERETGVLMGCGVRQLIGH